MKNLLLLILSIFITNIISAQIKIDNENYKFHIEYSKDWVKGNTVETNKKDVITYSFSKINKKDTITSSIIAFKLPIKTDIDDFIYKLEKDLNLNIPERSGEYTILNEESFNGKSAKYKDTETSEIIYYYSTNKDDSGEYYCYMIRFITNLKYNINDFNFEVSNIINSFKIKI